MEPLDNRSEELQRIYSQRFDAMLDYRNTVWKILTRNFFQRYIPTNAHVLDLGCGYGEFINNIEAGKKYAMDLNPEAQKRLGKSVTLFQQDCSAQWPLPDGSLDVVFTSNFFEHLPDKGTLKRTLQEVRRCLKPGGKLIAMGPNIRLLPGAYWDFWDHYLPLSEISLSEGLSNIGFKTETSKAHFLPYTMARGGRVPTFLIRLYLKIPLFWKFKGQQFLVIASK